MPTLFWRIFLSFWGAMTLIVVAVMAFTFWIVADAPANALARPRLDLLPREAERVLAESGTAGLRTWLKEQSHKASRGTVFIVDESRRELLGRDLPGPPERWALLTDGARLAPPDLALPVPAPPMRAPPGRVLGLPPEGLPFRRVARLAGPGGESYWMLILPKDRWRLIPPGLGRVPWVTLVLAIAISAAMCWALARYLSAPIHKLRAATQAVSGGNLGVRVSPSLGTRRDELGSLAEDFDRMSEHLRVLLDGRQQLMRDLSHELRSPLARLQIALGLARRPDANLEQEHGRIEQEAQRLDALVGQILKLSRLDDSSVALTRDTLDVRSLLEELAHDATLEARPRQVEVVLETGAAGSAFLTGDRQLLGSAIENVLRNAVHFTAQGSMVHIVLATSRSELELLIQDEGPGVPPEELTRIFEPFFRSNGNGHGHGHGNNNGGGHGIGLAITRRIVHLHGGSVTARNRPGGGLEVELHMPLK